MTDDPSEISQLFAEISLGAPENAIGFVLWRVVHRYQRAIDRALAPTDLTHLQFNTLAMTAWLNREGSVPSQAMIARAASIHPMQVSLVLKALEAKGMVRRIPDERRATAKRVEMTGAGVDALRIAMPIVISVQRQMFGQVGEKGGALLAALLKVEADDLSNQTSKMDDNGSAGAAPSDK